MVSTRMFIADQRRAAIGAVRSEMRKRGIEPKTATIEDAWQILDDISAQEPDLKASRWYRCHDNSQQAIFFREWKQWQKWHERNK